MNNAQLVELEMLLFDVIKKELSSTDSEMLCIPETARVLIDLLLLKNDSDDYVKVPVSAIDFNDLYWSRQWEDKEQRKTLIPKIEQDLLDGTKATLLLHK